MERVLAGGAPIYAMPEIIFCGLVITKQGSGFAISKREKVAEPLHKVGTLEEATKWIKSKIV